MSSSNRSMLLQLARLPPDLQATLVSFFTSQLSHAHQILTDNETELSAHREINLMSITVASFSQTLKCFEREMHNAVQQAVKQAETPTQVINYSFAQFPSSTGLAINAHDLSLQTIRVIDSSTPKSQDSPSSSSPSHANQSLAISPSTRSPRRFNARSPMRLEPVKEQAWDHSYQVTDDASEHLNSAEQRNPPPVPPIELPSGSPSVLDAICTAQMSNRSRKYMTAPHDLASMMAEWQASHAQKGANLPSRVLNETASPASPSSISSKSRLDRIHSMSKQSMSQQNPISDSSDDGESDSDDESSEIRSKRSSMTVSSSLDNPHQKYVRGAATMNHGEVRLMMQWMKSTQDEARKHIEPKPF